MCCGARVSSYVRFKVQLAAEALFVAKHHTTVNKMHRLTNHRYASLKEPYAASAEGASEETLIDLETILY